MCNCSISVEDNFTLYLEIQHKLILQLSSVLCLAPLCFAPSLSIYNVADSCLWPQTRKTARAHVTVGGSFQSSIKPETGISNCDIAASRQIANQIIKFKQMGLRPRVLKAGGLQIYLWICGFSTRLPLQRSYYLRTWLTIFSGYIIFFVKNAKYALNIIFWIKLDN